MNRRDRLKNVRQIIITRERIPLRKNVPDSNTLEAKVEADGNMHELHYILMAWFEPVQGEKDIQLRLPSFELDLGTPPL